MNCIRVAQGQDTTSKVNLGVTKGRGVGGLPFAALAKGGVPPLFDFSTGGF
jgi:hypothetical protein